MDELKPAKTSLRIKANSIKEFRCKNLIAVIENPDDIRNVGAIIRNVNALGVEKAYVVDKNNQLPKDWVDMREQKRLSKTSASAIKWSFVKVFQNTESCLEHLQKNGFTSIVTSPHQIGKENISLDEGDYTKFKKLAVWFGNESTGISNVALQGGQFCLNIPMFGMIESLNLGTSTGIVLYEITKQRRAFQNRHKNRLKENVNYLSESALTPDAEIE